MITKAQVADIVWDDKALTRMVGNNPAMHRRLFDKFLHGSEEFVAIIISAAAEKNLATVAEVAHKMKSSARTVGALQLGELCEQLETSAKSGDVDLVILHAAGLELVFAAVAAKIRGSLE